MCKKNKQIKIKTQQLHKMYKYEHTVNMIP